MLEVPVAEVLDLLVFLRTLNGLCENSQQEAFINNTSPEVIEKRGSLGANVLVAAILIGEYNFAVIETLVKYKNGVLVNVPDILGKTAIHYAVMKGNLQIVKLLCEEGNANTDHVDNVGNTLLHQFFLSNVKNGELLSYLMRGKPQQHKKTSVPNNLAKGMRSTPAMLAISMNSPYMTQMFREMRDIPTERNPIVERRKIALDLSLFEIQDGDLDELKFVIDKFGDSVDGNGDTLLHSLTKFGLSNKEAIDYCLKEPFHALGDQINAQNREGKTPLYVLLDESRKTSEMLFEALFEHPSLDLTIRDSMGWTILKPAMKQSNKIFLRIYDSNPSLFFALNLNHKNVFIYLFDIIIDDPFELLKALIEEHDLDLTSTDDLGRNIFHICAEFSGHRPHIYDYLYSKLPVSPQTMVNVKADGYYGYTPMMLAIISANEYFFKHLFSKFDIDLTLTSNSNTENYLTLAIKYSSLDIQIQILKRCPELADFVSDLGITPVMIAIAESKLELTKILINEYNVDINVKNVYGNTILHYLANHRVQDTELIELLLNGDRNCAFYINQRNEEGMTPFAIAMERETIELANAFSKYLTTEADIAQIDVIDVSNEKPLVKNDVDRFVETFDEARMFDDLRILIEKNDLESIKTYTENKNLYEVLHFISNIQDIGPNVIDFFLYECPKTRQEINHQNKYGETPLHCAAVRERIPLVNALLKHPEVNTKIQNKKGETALLAAINNTWVQFSEDVIQMLVMHEPSLVHISDFYGMTPLQASILHDHFNVLKFIVEKGADLHYVDSDEDTLAHFLAGYQKQDTEVINFLMNKPNNVLKHINKRNKNGNTPLHAACKNNNEKYVLYLLGQKRIDLSRVNNMDETPLFVCLSINRKTASAKIIDELVKKCPVMVSKPNFVGDLPILLALNVENHDAVKVLIEDGRIDVNAWKDKQQNTLLHYLFLYGIQDRKIFKLLIDKGQSVINNPNNLGETILHFACRDHHLDILHLLIQCPDVDLSLQNSNGDTPLMELLKSGQNNGETTILVKLFISLFPSSKNMINYRGIAPIHKALKNGLFDVAQCLLPITDDAHDSTDNMGNNLLHYLARYAKFDEKLIRKFLKDMSQPEIERIVNNARNTDGKTALDLAKECKNDIFLSMVNVE